LAADTAAGKLFDFIHRRWRILVFVDSRQPVTARGDENGDFEVFSPMRKETGGEIGRIRRLVQPGNSRMRNRAAAGPGQQRIVGSQSRMR